MIVGLISIAIGAIVYGKRRPKKKPRIVVVEQPNYNEYINSLEWERLRGLVLMRDKNQCVLCSSGKRLQVHHLTYERLGHEKLEDLQTLCYECHQKLHVKRRAGK